MRQQYKKYRINMRVKIFNSNWMRFYADFSIGFPVPLYRQCDWIMSNCGQCPQYCDFRINKDGMMTRGGKKLDYVQKIEVFNYRDRLDFYNLGMEIAKRSYREDECEKYIGRIINTFAKNHFKQD